MKKRRLHIDIESYSECNLKECGVYVYSEHSSTEILCVCFRFDDGAVHLWVPRWDLPLEAHQKLTARLDNKYGVDNWTYEVHPKCPAVFAEHLEADGEWAAHNSGFERTVINGHAGQDIGMPKLKIETSVCTAAKAATYGLPRDLGGATKAMKTYPKDDTGRNIMLKLCRPRSGKEKRYSIEENIDDYVHLYCYCADDVFAECGLDAALPDVSPTEREDWIISERINDRGVGVDLDRIADVQFLIREYKETLDRTCRQITGFAPTQREKIVDWVRANGYPQIPNMQADTVLHAVEDSNCPTAVKGILSLYSVYGMKAVAKFDAIEAAVAADFRIHGMMLYYGAGTGRWSSLIVQLQNLYRPKIDDPDTAISAYASRSLELIQFLYPGLDPMKVFASTVRGMLVPADGCDLAVLDFAGIESRFLAWLFDEEWKLAAFRARDVDPRNNPDNYQLAYGRGFNVDPSGVKGFQRQIGKVMELALGYEGGVGAFVTMAPTYKVDLSELADKARGALPEWALDAANWMWKKIECKRGRPSGLNERIYTTIDGVKQVWRSLHPCVKQGWRDTLDAAKLAVKHPGKVYGIPNKKLMFQVRDRWLLMRLPSGRTLKYFEPELHDDRSDAELERIAGEVEIARINGVVYQAEDDLAKWHLTYMGVDAKTKQWRRESTYGGKIVENADQGGSNCLLRGAIRRVERHGYQTILTVHDEGAWEVNEGFGSMDELTKLVCANEPWAFDLPVTAEGYRAKRYRKG